MKNLRWIGIIALLAVGFAACTPRSDKRAEIMEKLEAGEIPADVVVFGFDTYGSIVEWEGKKITGSGHNGVISVKSGELYVYEGELLAGNVVIDMTSIVVTDIEDPGMNARLKGHLESDDFFSVASYPEASLEIVSFEALEGNPGNYRVSGNLTIKDITHGIAFVAAVSQDEETITASADFDFDRSLYEVRFGSGKFFENLGDNLINDNINLKMQIVARR